MPKKESSHRIYRWRALVAGAGTAALGACGLLLAPTEAPLLWDGMLNHALPLVITTLLFGAATAVMLLLEKERGARFLIVLETAGLFGSWGLSQLSYLIPPDVMVESPVGSPAIIIAMLTGTT